MNKIILTGKWDMNYIGKVLSDLLSKQYDTEITVRFIPKEKNDAVDRKIEERRHANEQQEAVGDSDREASKQGENN